MTPEELKKLEATLWRSADTLRANSDLKSSEYSTPVMGRVFFKYIGDSCIHFIGKRLNATQALNKNTFPEKFLYE